MTGVGGRPEVIIEGANDLKGPWYEYNFKYKPGNVNSSLPIVGKLKKIFVFQLVTNIVHFNFSDFISF